MLPGQVSEQRSSAEDDQSDDDRPERNVSADAILGRVEKHLSGRSRDAVKARDKAEDRWKLSFSHDKLVVERENLLARIRDIDDVLALSPAEHKRTLDAHTDETLALSDAGELIRDYRRVHQRLSYNRRASHFRLQRHGDDKNIDVSGLTRLVREDNATLDGCLQFVDEDVRPRVTQLRAPRVSQYCLLTPKEGGEVALLIEDFGLMWSNFDVSFAIAPLAVTTRYFKCICPGCLLSNHPENGRWRPDSYQPLLRDELRSAAAEAGVSVVVGDCDNGIDARELGFGILKGRRGEGFRFLPTTFAGTSLLSLIDSIRG
jgi:hypothetical protein